ncbi:MAG: hypothetical protein K2H03_08905, partial [Muribaculaceae bacterium]|nr:hypothetical protein [Muribaculaceae bacterium]
YIYTDDYNAYTVLKADGREYLVRASRDRNRESDGNGNIVEVVGPWYYEGRIFDPDTYNTEYVKVEIDESQIVYPSDVVEHSYELEPHLVFPDQTSFAFGEFFDELSFSDLVDEYNNIIDTYLSITGQDEEDDPDDCIE